ncbi:ring finger domain [Lasius niger]|uniref:Ring finger domain n=1 Tax=Lasius niger TaxID=67767 RepID=A0A0J7JUZ0_LASNI|nr:ring finger domain [Lasius niger]
MDEDDLCSVCCESLLFHEQLCLRTACRHRFHALCIALWFGRSDLCPNCRRVARPHQLRYAIVYDRFLESTKLVSDLKKRQRKTMKPKARKEFGRALMANWRSGIEGKWFVGIHPMTLRKRHG